MLRRLEACRQLHCLANACALDATLSLAMHMVYEDPNFYSLCVAAIRSCAHATANSPLSMPR